jgi:hypothetical protein
VVETRAGIAALALPQRRIAFGAQNSQLLFQRTRAALEIGELDGLLAVEARQWRGAAIRVAMRGLLPLGARQCMLALAFATTPIGGAATHRRLALKAWRRTAAAFNMQAPRILMNDPARRAPFELARGRRAIDVSWRMHAAFSFMPRPAQRRLRFGDGWSKWDRLRDTRPIERAGSRIAAALGDRSADDRPIGAMDTDILRDNKAFWRGSGARRNGSGDFRRGGSTERNGRYAF